MPSFNSRSLAPGKPVLKRFVYAYAEYQRQGGLERRIVVVLQRNPNVTSERGSHRSERPASASNSCIVVTGTLFW